LGRLNESTWSAARDATTSDVVWDIYANVTVSADYSTEYNYECKRVFLYFDTSDIPDDAIVDAAYLNLKIGPVSGNGEIEVFAGTQGDTLDTSDFTAFGTTLFGSATCSDNEGWKRITLNDDGVNHINVYGTTKFCIRHKYDVDNTEPTTTNNVAFSSANDTGNEPYL